MWHLAAACALLAHAPAGPCCAPAAVRVRARARPASGADIRSPLPHMLATANLVNGAPSAAAGALPIAPAARARPREPRLRDVLRNEDASISAALSSEWRALLRAERVHMPLGGVCVLMWHAAHGRVCAAPATYVLARGAVQLALRRVGTRDPLDRPGARLAAAAAAGALARAAGLACGAAALGGAAGALASCAAAVALLDAARRRGVARRVRAAHQLAEAHAASPLVPPPAPSADSRAWAAASGRQGRAALTALALGATELLWACEEAASALAWACERVLVAWLPAAIARLSTLDYAQARRGAAASVASAAGALSSLPDTLAYQANIRGLQFENFLADSWASWLRLRGKWLREGGKRRGRAKGKAAPADGTDWAAVLETTFQATLTAAKGGWVRWQLDAAKGKAGAGGTDAQPLLPSVGRTAGAAGSGTSGASGATRKALPLPLAAPAREPAARAGGSSGGPWAFTQRKAPPLPWLPAQSREPAANEAVDARGGGRGGGRDDARGEGARARAHAPAARADEGGASGEDAPPSSGPFSALGGWLAALLPGGARAPPAAGAPSPAARAAAAPPAARAVEAEASVVAVTIVGGTVAAPAAADDNRQSV
ncbi:hypothetical protein KFE25_010932 [Diacronema lutheri]|uniref:Uncharacterized protein n=1 Tax=Diacronema lutheri TaxID=2081491 RepID=A0A8J5XAJ7_DIALT|nr:hypothetical protein KFE25_010932 [Diacronema lutheri]